MLWSAVAATVLGCSSDSAGPGGVVTDGQVLSCKAPACCLPLDINLNKVIVDRANSQISIDVILDVPAPITVAWNASVEVSLSWGPSVTCTTAVSSYDQRFFSLSCPSVPLDGAPQCDSTFTLALRPSSSTYADSAGTQVLCAGKAGARVQYSVAMKCPTCPYISGSGSEPCDYPNATCNYSAYMQNGTFGTLPCTCNLNGVTGDRRWSCAIP
jgi:hypothetical protein